MIVIIILICVFFFFFKQKTAYEMRISDWSSDVCSSDLSAILQNARATSLLLSRRAIAYSRLTGFLPSSSAGRWRYKMQTLLILPAIAAVSTGQPVLPQPASENPSLAVPHRHLALRPAAGPKTPDPRSWRGVVTACGPAPK